MSDEQPELRWAPIPPKPTNRRRVWLIVGLSVAAVAIVGILLFIFLPRDGEPNPTASPSLSASPSASPTGAPGTTSPAAPVPPEPTAPMVTPPPVGDPDLETFASLVKPRLDDAVTGLSIAAGMSGQDAASVVDQLQQDAGRLSDSVAPSSISDSWYEAVSQYAGRLAELRAAYEGGSDAQGAMGAAETALQDLRTIAGL